MTKLEKIVELSKVKGFKSLHDECRCTNSCFNCSCKQVLDGCLGVVFAEKLLEPYDEPIELTQFEYDLLGTIDNQRFEQNGRNMKMKKLGYFKGVTDTKMMITNIRKNAKVV